VKFRPLVDRPVLQILLIIQEFVDEFLWYYLTDGMSQLQKKNIYFGADLDRGMLNEIFTIAEWAVVQILRPAL